MSSQRGRDNFTENLRLDTLSTGLSFVTHLNNGLGACSVADKAARM